MSMAFHFSGGSQPAARREFTLGFKLRYSALEKLIKLKPAYFERVEPTLQ